MIWIVVGILVVWLFILSVRSPKTLDLGLPPNTLWNIPPKTAKEIYEELKAKEKLYKEYKQVHYYLWHGKKVTKPTQEQLESSELLPVSKWVKK